jgi:hypothetical protein
MATVFTEDMAAAIETNSIAVGNLNAFYLLVMGVLVGATCCPTPA